MRAPAPDGRSRRPPSRRASQRKPDVMTRRVVDRVSFQDARAVETIGDV
jgi:hypothetical protein